MATREPRHFIPTILIGMGSYYFSTSQALAQTGYQPDVAWFFLVLSIIILFYLIPTVVAFSRGHPNRWAIFVLNICFGATGFGWLGTLVWACSAIYRPGPGDIYVEPNPNLLVNDVRRVELLNGSKRIPIEELERLQSLYEKGAIDLREFQTLKAAMFER